MQPSQEELKKALDVLKAYGISEATIKSVEDEAAKCEPKTEDKMKEEPSTSPADAKKEAKIEFTFGKGDTKNIL